MAAVELVDRAAFLAHMYRELRLDPRQTAVVTIDMHRGHLDMAVATMPASPQDAERVIANGRAALDFARQQNIPVIHVVLTFRRLPDGRTEGQVSEFWKAVNKQAATDRLTPGRNSTTSEHNVEGMPGTQIIPALFREGDFVINNKKRLDCFYGTDLRLLLDARGVKNVVLMGINTNTCVLNTSFTAFNFDYRVVVLSDCVASMYGDDLHALGLQNVARCMGWVISNEQFFEKIRAGGAA
jgi:nicotinamidase-related amidase